MPFVVHVEPVVDGVGFQVGDESRSVDDGHIVEVTVRRMTVDRLAVLHEVADAVAAAFAGVSDFGPSGARDGQYALDVVADEAALAVLRRVGVGILSEESGLETVRTGEVVIIDPIDGSTNASRGVPWFATAMCWEDDSGPLASLVVNQASGVRYWAERGAGAFCDGVRLDPSNCRDLSTSIVALNGVPGAPLGSRQSRMLGAAALDLCLVAGGVLDAYVDCAVEAHGVWDYAASVHICREAGAVVADAFGRELLVLDHAARRTPIAAGTPELLAALLQRRR